MRSRFNFANESLSSQTELPAFRFTFKIPVNSPFSKLMARQFFTAFYTAPRLINEDLVHTSFSFDSLSSSARVFFRRAVSYSLASAVGVLLVSTVLTTFADAQDAKQDMKQPGPSQPAETEKNAAQIELLETKYRFETNGDSRKEVHTRVRINNELGVRQFARLNFDFNRSFQAVEIPLVRITHPSGGTADILASAIADNPNPAVVDAPAYQDVRIKSVRILGLQPGDLLEYRVITTTTHHPLAPDFWLDHTFDNSGVVTEEIFDVDLPLSRKPEIRINPHTPAASTDKSGEGENVHIIYRWDRKNSSTSTEDDSNNAAPDGPASPDIALSTFGHWRTLSKKLADALTPGAVPINLQDSREEQWKQLRLAPTVPEAVSQKAAELTASAGSDAQRTQAIYDFVSTKIATIDLPLGATGFSVRTSDTILSSAYATQEEKFVLFSALAKALELDARPLLTGFSDVTASIVPMPSVFKHLVILGEGPHYHYWMDPSLEVAPFGMVAPVREKFVFLLDRANHLIPEKSPRIDSSVGVWRYAPRRPPFPEFQRVAVDAAAGSDGTLTAKVKYTMRGENELTLRVTFHKTPKEKWKNVAQLLAVSDGFRGQITNVTASDPYATKEPFLVEYEITQPKFIDWSKKPVRIPALLPSPGLPDPTTSSHHSSSKKSIDLGTPLEIDLDATVTLPEATTAQAPTGTSVERDYATFSSKYSVQGGTLYATRKLHFISSEIPATRAGDLNAFLHAVQADQTQLFTLQRSDTAAK
jgi:hypothetical protein